MLVAALVLVWDRSDPDPSRAADLSASAVAAQPQQPAPPSPATAPNPTPAPAPAPAPTPAPPPEPTASERIGLDRIDRTLGDRAPTGRGVQLAHVEGQEGQYTPDLSAPRFHGMNINARSGPSTVSGHSQSVARFLYGTGSFAPGIQSVDCYTSADFLQAAVLKLGRPEPPTTAGARLFNHSWISQETTLAASDILRRIDYLIDTHDVQMIVGVNNHSTSKVPPLLASGYNSIAVGHWTGNSSRGLTRFEGDGRCKPDLVAPNGLTSFATPTVAAVVARLLEAADRQLRARPDSARSEVIRAVLLAGADKPDDWQPAPDRPLDDRYGAGRVRADRSLIILTAPITRPNAAHGWSFQSVAPLRPMPVASAPDSARPSLPPMTGASTPDSASATLTLRNPHDSAVVSIIAAWNRRIDGTWATDLLTRQPAWNNSPRRADFTLTLERLNDHGSLQPIARSDSPVDNLEHIYLTGLPSGDYRIIARRTDALDEPWDIAIAWRLDPAE